MIMALIIKSLIVLDIVIGAVMMISLLRTKDKMRDLADSLQSSWIGLRVVYYFFWGFISPILPLLFGSLLVFYVALDYLADAKPS